MTAEQWGIARVDTTRKPVRVVIWQELGRTPMGEDATLHYDSVDCLPEWAQRKLAVLMGIDHTAVNEDIPNVGRRISRYVFWVYLSVGEKLGSYPRKKGKGSRS